MSDNKYNNVMHLGNPTNTIAVLNRYGFDFKKKFGQNFLIDENVVEKIVREAGVTKDDFVVEVGPGIGTMTQILCENAREVVAVEIDKKLIPILTEDTLSYSLHIALKGIKARELIRTLALNKIFLTNGEGCSLGLSKPSRIIQVMGYDELTSRNSISFSFVDELSAEDIEKVVNTVYLKYKQIKSLGN